MSLNVGLILFLVLAFRKPDASPAIASSDNNAPVSERLLRARNHRASRIPSQWSQVESDDLAIYAANLRAAGCPPKTARDILLPLIEEKFAPSASPEPTNFWASFSERQAAAATHAEQERALKKEKETMLKELFGFVWTSEGLKRACAGEAAGLVGFLDFERAGKFLCVAERFEKEFSLAGSRRIDRRAALYEAWREEAGATLSSAEFEEIELRGLLAVWQNRNPNLCNAGLSGAELRQLMVYLRESCHPLPDALLAGLDELLREPDLAGERQFNTKARALLGDDRFIDYLKSCDVCVEKTLAALEKERLPRKFALELFDFRQEALIRAQEIRQMPLRRSEKRAQLAVLRESALEQLAALPNTANDQPWLDINRDWLPDDTKHQPSADSALLEINRDWLQEIAHP